jgi:hypothetical protein
MIFFKNRRKLRGFFGMLTTIFLFLVVFLSGPVMSVENSDSAKNLVPTLLNNADVRASLSNKIVDQIAKGNTNQQLVKVIEIKRPQLVKAISDGLGSPATITELQNDVELGYHFVTTNEPSVTIQAKPLLVTFRSALSKVDSQFKDTKKILKDVKPMVMTRDGKMPQIGAYLSYARDAYVGLIILLAISLFFFLRFSASGKRALRAMGTRVLAVGVLAIAQFFAIAIIASKFANKATDTLAKTIIPVAARALFSYYQSIGIGLAIVGAVAIFISTRMSGPTKKTAGARANGDLGPDVVLGDFAKRFIKNS